MNRSGRGESLLCHSGSELTTINPCESRSPVLGANDLKFEWFVPKMGLQVLKGLIGRRENRRAKMMNEMEKK